MVKSKLTINVETWLLEEAKSYQINFSQTMEEILRHKINYLKGDLSSINIKQTKRELDRKEKKLTKIQAEVSNLRDSIQKWEELKEQKESERIQEEKEKIDKMKKCINCGKLFAEAATLHTFPKGKICNACFMTANKKAIQKWRAEE